jgi:hypothetical protein
VKPVKISVKQYSEIHYALKRKARKLSAFSPERFLARSIAPCTHFKRRHYELPNSYHATKKPNVVFIEHFLPFPCDCETRARVGSKEEAICLCKTVDGYYLTTHRIGRCPWKTAKKGGKIK